MVQYFFKRLFEKINQFYEIMQSYIARYTKSFMEKHESESSAKRIAEHASNSLSNRNSLEGFSQRESSETAAHRTSLASLKASQNRLLQLRGHQHVASPVSLLSSRTSQGAIQPQFKWQTDTLCVKQNQISGWLRKTVQQVKLFQKSQFPLRFYVVNMSSKSLYIFDKPGGKLKQDLSLSGMRCVVQLNLQSRLENGGMDKALSPKTSKELQSLPKDFTEPFAIFIKDQVMLLWAKSPEEQTLWRRELKQLLDPANRVQIDSAGFVQDFERNMTYSYQLFQQLQRQRTALQDTPRPRKQQTQTNNSASNINQNTDGNNSSFQLADQKGGAIDSSGTAHLGGNSLNEIDTRWVQNFYLIFTKTGVTQDEEQEASISHVQQPNDDQQLWQESIPAKLKNVELQCISDRQRELANISQTMRSIIDEILYQSSTCFQMEYVLMGYLKVSLRRSAASSSQDEEPTRQIRVKGQLAVTETNNQVQSFDTYFCAINFNLRQFAMIKMRSKRGGRVDAGDSGSDEFPMMMIEELEAGDESAHYAFTDLLTVTSAHHNHHIKKRSTSDAANLLLAKTNYVGNTNIQVINQAKNNRYMASQQQQLQNNKTQQGWLLNELSLTMKGGQSINLHVNSKKEKQLWLTEFSRAIEWQDGASPAKVSNNRSSKSNNLAMPGQRNAQEPPRPSKNEVLIQEIESMEPAMVDGLSMPPLQFFCYKNFMTGMVRVKVSNFESILKTKHNYPIQKLKLVLKLQGSCLYLESEKYRSGKTQLGIMTLEKASLEKQISIELEGGPNRQTQENNNGEKPYHNGEKRKSSFGRLFNRMIGSKSPKGACSDEEISTQFGFSLKTEAKTYTLFTSSQQEAEVWVRVLSLICEMNRRDISVDTVNPFDYEQYKLKKADMLKQNQNQITSESEQIKLTNVSKSVEQPPSVTQPSVTQADVNPKDVCDQRAAAAHQQVQEKSQGLNNQACGQIKILGIQSQAQNSMTAEETMQQQDCQKDQSQHQPAAQISNSSTEQNLIGANGLALKLENCKVGQIVIQVNNQSQLASMGLDHLTTSNPPRPADSNPSSQSANQNSVQDHHHLKPSSQHQHQNTSNLHAWQQTQQWQTPVNTPPAPVPIRSRNHHASQVLESADVSRRPSITMPTNRNTSNVDPAAPNNTCSQQPTEQEAANSLSRPIVVAIDKVNNFDGNARSIVRNFRVNQFNSARRKKEKQKVEVIQQSEIVLGGKDGTIQEQRIGGNQTGVAGHAIGRPLQTYEGRRYKLFTPQEPYDLVQNVESTTVVAPQRPPSHLVVSISDSKQRDGKLANDQISYAPQGSALEQANPRPRSSLLLKGTGKRVFPKRNTKKQKQSDVVVSRKNIVATLTVSDYKIENAQNQPNSTSQAQGCLIVPKRYSGTVHDTTDRIKKKKLVILNSTSSAKKQSKPPLTSHLSTDNLHYQATSEDILRQIGSFDRQQQELRELNSGLPTFAKSKQPETVVVFNPPTAAPTIIGTSAPRPLHNNSEVMQALSSSAKFSRDSSYSYGCSWEDQPQQQQQSATQSQLHLLQAKHQPHPHPPVQASCSPLLLPKQKHKMIKSNYSLLQQPPPHNPHPHQQRRQQLLPLQQNSLINFEQRIENQRETNFLDKLIAHGDKKYGVHSSTLLSQQFNNSHLDQSSDSCQRKAPAASHNHNHDNLEHQSSMGQSYGGSPTMINQSRNMTRKVSQSANNPTFNQATTTSYQQQHYYHSPVKASNSCRKSNTRNGKKVMNNSTTPYNDMGTVHRPGGTNIQSCEVSDWDDDDDDDDDDDNASKVGQSAHSQYVQIEPKPSTNVDHQRGDHGSQKLGDEQNNFEPPNNHDINRKRQCQKQQLITRQIKDNSQIASSSQKSNRSRNNWDDRIIEKPSIFVEDFESTWD